MSVGGESRVNCYNPNTREERERERLYWMRKGRER